MLVTHKSSWLFWFWTVAPRIIAALENQQSQPVQSSSILFKLKIRKYRVWQQGEKKMIFCWHRNSRACCYGIFSYDVTVWRDTWPLLRLSSLERITSLSISLIKIRTTPWLIDRALWMYVTSLGSSPRGTGLEVTLGLHVAWLTLAKLCWLVSLDSKSKNQPEAWQQLSLMWPSSFCKFVKYVDYCESESCRRHNTWLPRNSPYIWVPQGRFELKWRVG